MAELNDDYISVQEGGDVRKLCARPVDDDAAVPLAKHTFGETPTTRLIPRNEWQPVDLSAFVSPIKDQNGIGACFPPGTLVRMANGSQRRIEDVRLLDEVLTAEGNVRKVLRTMVRPHADGVKRICLWGHRHLRATAEHPIFTKRGYVRADELKAGDWVGIPKYAPMDVESIVPADYVEVYSTHNARRTYAHAATARTLGIPGKAVVTMVRTPLPEVIQLDRDFGRLIGLYLAEGSSTAGKITFHFHENEADTLAAEVVETFRRLFGVEALVSKNRGNARVCEVKVYGTGWAALFTKLCSAGSKNKEPHADLLAGSKEFLSGMLDGWMAGDGLGRDTLRGGITISHSLAMGMYGIASYLGFRPTIETFQGKPGRGVKSRQMRYMVKWPASGEPHPTHDRIREDEKHVWRTVHKIEHEAYAGYVYNLEVEGDNSYVAEGIGVHNCNAFATINALEACRRGRGLPDVKLSPGDLYSRINGGRDNGSLPEDALKVALSVGVATANTVPPLQWRSVVNSADAVAERPKYRFLESLWCPTFDHAASALQQGFYLDTAVWWWQYDSPDADGWLKARGSGSKGGHAICGCALENRSGTWGIKIANSWGTAWGRNGFGVLPEQRCAEGTQVFRWWALREVVQESGELPVPKFG